MAPDMWSGPRNSVLELQMGRPDTSTVSEDGNLINGQIGVQTATNWADVPLPRREEPQSMCAYGEVYDDKRPLV